MPIPAKPCEGRFSDEVLEMLNKNRDRDQWANHTCEVCGLSVGARIEKGKWIPEQHWPSVKFQPRKTSEKKKSAATPTESMVSNDETVLAESASR